MVVAPLPTPEPEQDSANDADCKTLPPLPRSTTANVDVGTVLGRYKLLRNLGGGGMGSVFEAVHLELGRKVALKVLHPSLGSRSAGRERFLREARAAARVRHPGVVQVHDVFTEDSTPFLVMDLLEGENLEQRLLRGPLQPSEVVALLGPALDGLACVHEAGIVHRDLKPANLVLVQSPEGERAVLVDFGVSREVDDASDLTGAVSVLGTPAFMSPEQARGERVLLPASDQFSMGSVLYLCLSGRRPFEGPGTLELLAQVQRPPRERLSELVPNAPPRFVAAIERAMSLEPRRRFASVRELRDALVEALRAPPPRLRRLALPLGLGLLLAVSSALAIPRLRAATPARTAPPVARLEAPPPTAPLPPAPSAPLPSAPPPTLAAPPPSPAPPLEATPSPPPAPPSRAARVSPRRAAPAAPEAPAPSPPPIPAPSPPPAPVAAETPAPAPASSPPPLGRNRAVILGR